jgi:hypothetical protein
VGRSSLQTAFECDSKGEADCIPDTNAKKQDGQCITGFFWNTNTGSCEPTYEDIICMSRRLRHFSGRVDLLCWPQSHTGFWFCHFFPIICRHVNLSERGPGFTIDMCPAAVPAAKGQGYQSNLDSYDANDPNTWNRRCYPHRLQGKTYPHCAFDTFAAAAKDITSDYWLVCAGLRR